jgi:hypothetical protein
MATIEFSRDGKNTFAFSGRADVQVMGRVLVKGDTHDYRMQLELGLLSPRAH